jgi:hypothetical protein
MLPIGTPISPVSITAGLASPATIPTRIRPFWNDCTSTPCYSRLVQLGRTPRPRPLRREPDNGDHLARDGRPPGIGQDAVGGVG